MNLIKEITQKGLIVLKEWKKEISIFKNQLCNILYRNKKAKNAWIRKLAHFIVKEAVFKYNDEKGEHHISDWFECFHEISKDANKDIGYNKMIGNRDDLTIFDDKIKNSYTVTLPLIFYFNKNKVLSLPLNSSINTKI